MKKLKLTGFDIGMIIAFVVVTALGGGAWYYLSGQLQTAQQQVTDAKTQYDKLSVVKQGTDAIIVSSPSSQTLQANIDLLNSEVKPVIQDKLLAKGNQLQSKTNENPVDWKQDLDKDVTALTAEAKVRGVALQPSFYFGFSYYLGHSPSDEATSTLNKQLLGISEVSKILIEAGIKSISSIRRTYDEDPHSSGGNGGNNGGPGGNNNNNVTFTAATEPDRLSGISFSAPGDAYHDYPFQVEFDAKAEDLRTVMDNLLKSPYIFIVRTMTVDNSEPQSPKVSSLQAIAGAPTPSVADSSPGEVASTASTKGPQFLFGNSVLHIKARIDLIEWTDMSLVSTPDASGNSTNAALSPRGN